MPFELLIFSVGWETRVFCPSCHPCDAHQRVNVGWSPSFWIRCGPLWPQAGSLNLSLPQFLYYKGHTDLPHRDVVRINKCWYSALETWRCCVNVKSEQSAGQKAIRCSTYLSISWSVCTKVAFFGGKRVGRMVHPLAPFIFIEFFFVVVFCFPLHFLSACWGVGRLEAAREECCLIWVDCHTAGVF